MKGLRFRAYLKSPAAINKRPLYPSVAHTSPKVAHNFGLLAFPLGTIGPISHPNSPKYPNLWVLGPLGSLGGPCSSLGRLLGNVGPLDDPGCLGSLRLVAEPRPRGARHPNKTHYRIGALGSTLT